jgi:hypothetical protein
MALRAWSLPVGHRSFAVAGMVACSALLIWSAGAQSALPNPDRCISDADIKTLTAEIDALRPAGTDMDADVQLVLDRHIAGCSFDEAIEKLKLAGFIAGEYPDVSQSLREKGYVRTGNAHRKVGWFFPLSVVVDLFGRDDGSFDMKGRFFSDGP